MPYQPRRRAFRPRPEALERRALLSADVSYGMWPLRDPAPAESVIVKFQPGTPAAAESADLNALGAYVAQSWSFGAGLWTLGQGVGRDSAIKLLQADPRVLYAQANNVLVTANTPNDPSFSQQWGLNQTNNADIDAPEAWGVTTGSTSVLVADTDTGIDYTHPDLYLNIAINQNAIPAAMKAAIVHTDGGTVIDFRDLNSLDANGNVVLNGNGQPVNSGSVTDFNGNGYIDPTDILADPRWDNGLDGVTGLVNDLVGWNFIANTNSAQDDHGHGTHTAGTIGAVTNNGVGVAGVDWNAQILPVKMLDSHGNGTDAQAISAIEYATALGAKVINASWGGTPNDSALSDAIGASGAVFVAAAGNSKSNNDTTPFYPASFGLSNEIAVAAVDSNGNLSGFSDYGPTTVQLAAPGSQVLSTELGGGYGKMSGTSMAAPHVSGVIALVAGLHPTWTPQQLIQDVVSTTKPLPALAGKVVTGGMVDAWGAVLDEAATVGDVTGTAGASGKSNFDFTVTLSAPAPGTVTIHYATADGTAVAGKDYTGVSGNLTIPSGASSGTIAVPVYGTLKYQLTKTFTVNLSNPSANVALVRPTATGTILYSNPMPSLAINNVTKVVNETGATTFSFTVTLSAVSGVTTKVNYATADGTALVADGDYTAKSGTLSIAAGNTKGTITITAYDSETVEATGKTFAVNLSAPVNATVAQGKGTGTLNDPS